MEYKLKDGSVVDESYFEKLSEEAGEGNYPGTPGEWIVRPKGRPALCDEELVTVAFKVPKSQRDAMDKRAASRNESRSEYLRATVARDLAIA